MNNCFVESLLGAVDNDKLLQLGEMRADIRQGRGVNSNANGFDVVLNIISGSGTFPNGTQTVSMNGGQTNIQTAATSGVLQILNKYGLTRWYDSNYNYIVDLKDIQYCTRLKECVGWIIGDLKYLPVKASSLTQLDLSASGGVYGDVENVKNFDHVLNTLYIAGSVYGNIAAIGNKANDLSINSDGSKGMLTGNITAFGTYSNLAKLRVLGGNLTGDISNIGLADGIVALDGVFTWNGRTKDSNLPTLGFINGVETHMVITNIDDAINDWATLTPPSTSNAKRIRVYGNRTSASDAAYATLQSTWTTVDIIPYTE